MRLLILGGTVFLGRHLVDAALAQGHDVTLFNRGKTNAALFPGVEKLRGDRDGDLSALAGRRWDAVIDTCGYVPRIVRAAAERLADAVDHYTFISSISVYPAEGLTNGPDETTPAATIADETTEEITGETYGPLKALCEQAAEAAMPGRVLIVRPGLIVGPFDPTDRFTYWPHRLAQGEEILAPGPPEAPVQFIDVRDLAVWTIKMIEQRQTGIFNASGPAQPLSMAQFLAACASLVDRQAVFTWVDATFLLAQEVGPFVELPLWLPKSLHNLMRADCSKAIQAGLTFHAISQTAQETLAWSKTRPDDHPWRAGLSRDREQTLLKLWKQQA